MLLIGNALDDSVWVRTREQNQFPNVLLKSGVGDDRFSHTDRSPAQLVVPSTQKGSSSGDRCTMGPSTSGGSIYGVGWGFKAFRINDLEMVDQNSVSWNRVANWLRQVDQLQHAT